MKSNERSPVESGDSRDLSDLEMLAHLSLIQPEPPKPPTNTKHYKSKGAMTRSPPQRDLPREKQSGTPQLGSRHISWSYQSRY